MLLLKECIDPDGMGRGESELPKSIGVELLLEPDQQEETVQMLDASGAEEDWHLQRRACALVSPNALLPAGTQGENPVAWVL